MNARVNKLLRNPYWQALIATLIIPTVLAHTIPMMHVPNADMYVTMGYQVFDLLGGIVGPLFLWSLLREYKVRGAWRRFTIAVSVLWVMLTVATAVLFFGKM